MHNERNNIFANFRKDTNSELLKGFTYGLFYHLSDKIIVKESRLRYQREQFNRLIFA